MKSKFTNLILVVAFLSVMNANAQKAYITNNGSNTVSVVDVTTNAVTTTIPVGNNPIGVSVSPNGKMVVVTNSIDNTISIINTATNVVTNTIPTGGVNPLGICVSHGDTIIYITDANSNIVTLVSTITNALYYSINVGNSPAGIAINPDGTTIYVANYDDNTVNVINTTTNTVTDTITVGSGPIGICVSFDGTMVYVANDNDSTVSVISTASNTVTATVNVGSGPFGIAINQSGTRVYVANGNVGNDSTVSVINTSTNTVSATITVGSQPAAGLSLSYDGSKLYVANFNSNTVSVINTTTNAVSATIPVGNEPYAFGNFITCAPLSPVISGASAFCQGDSILLNAGIYSSYLWSNGMTTDSIIVSSGNTYFVTVSMNNNGQCVGVDSQVVTMNPNPATPIITPNGPTTFCIGESVLLISSNYSNYDWYPGGQTTSHISVDSSGSYTVTIIDSNNCFATSLPIIVTAVNCAGINNISQTNKDITIYPNPASTLLNIHTNSQLSTLHSQLIITDLLGNEIYKEQLTGIDNTISIATFSNGLYFYEVRSTTGIARGKFVTITPAR